MKKHNLFIYGIKLSNNLLDDLIDFISQQNENSENAKIIEIIKLYGSNDYYLGKKLDYVYDQGEYYPEILLKTTASEISNEIEKFKLQFPSNLYFRFNERIGYHDYTD